MEREKLLVFDNISTVTNNNIPLVNLNLHVMPGEAYGIITTNGQEIQAVIDSISLATKSFEGRFLIQGREMNRQDVFDYVDILDTSTAIFENLSVFENLLVRELHRWFLFGRRSRRKTDDLFQKFGVPFSSRTRVDDLTREEQEILQLLGAYISKRSVVVINDYGSKNAYKYLDVQERLINEILKENRCIIYLSTKIETMLMNTDRFSLLLDGTIKDSFKTNEVIDNPQRVVNLLSGWVSVLEGKSQEDEKVLNSIVEARDLLSSTLELKNELVFLAKDITKVLKALKCSICLIDADKNGWMRTYSNLEKDVTPPAIVYEILEYMQEKEKEIFWQNGSALPGLFCGKGYKTIACRKIGSVNNTIGVVLVYYDEIITFGQKEDFYMNSFCKEISIAIETSRLIGKSVLLQESHHRMKNNLQMINSLNYLQKAAVRKGMVSPDDAFDSLARSVTSIAAVHDILSKDIDNNNLISINLIISKITKIYTYSGVKIAEEVDDITMPYNKAILISLLVNELINNSIKHAFVNVDNKQIDVSCKENESTIDITIADNGKGFNDIQRMNENRKKNGISIGLDLIGYIVSSLDGMISYLNDPGAVVSIRIPVSRVYDSMNTFR